VSSNPLHSRLASDGGSYGLPATPPPNAHRNSPVFYGPNGLRAGWRLAIFVILFILFGRVLNFVLHKIPSIAAWHKAVGENAMTPGLLLFDEGLAVALVLLIVFIMSLIEKRTFADYYLPPNQAFGQRFWQGVPYGFAMLSLLMGLIAAFHGFSIQGFALGGAVALKFGLLYFLGFILVGMLEEVMMRGYLQSTLGSGIGFWWAAVILSFLFGLGHIQNAAEDWFGAVMAGSFGLLAAFALYRTGETYFYGVPDSGVRPVGNLLNSTLSGPHWIAGGVVGPEGSGFAILVLAIGAVGIHFLFPRKQVVI
jgi:membrane protease YdiL (CAAX protease family)